jgi:hypothetical protein
MNFWVLIFRQSRVNYATYDGDRLPALNWDWPRGTWFQKRLQQLRKGNGRYSRALAAESLQ